MNSFRFSLVALGGLVLLSGCEAPRVFATADQRQNTQSARIEGTVVVSSTARGRAVVLLYDASKPPPPVGTGKPVSFTVVPRDDLFGSARPGDVGPFTAPFALSLVPVGKYLLRGFIDANDDFVPWYQVTSDVNAGDVGGAYVDPVTRAARVVDVVADDAGVPQPALDVPVTFADVARVPVDRPVFEVQVDGGVASGVSLTGAATVVDLVVRPVTSEFVNEPRPVFLAQLVDENQDGAPDLGPDGKPLMWPRVVVRKVVNAAVLSDDTTTDYDHVNPSNGAVIAADGVPDVVILAAGFDAAKLLPTLLDENGKVKTVPTPLTSLPLVIQSRALDAANPTQLGVLKSVPSGRYAITVIQSTGQTWRVPNELAPDFAAGVGLSPVASQGLTLQVP